MLREVTVIKDTTIIYKSSFGKGIDQEAFKHIYKQIQSIVATVQENKPQFHDYFNYKIAFIYDSKRILLFMIITDLTDDNNRIQKEMKKLQREFMGMFEAVLSEPKLDLEIFKMFDAQAESFHKNLKAKVSLVGFSGVGKTTIMNLIQEKEIPTEHIPTITGDVGVIKIGKLFFHLWDFAGQEQFSFLWNDFIQGSDAVLLITDSSLENCEKSKYFVELIRKEASHTHPACIANKQDLPGALSAEEVAKMLGLRTYGMVAIDPANHEKMMGVLADVLDLNVDLGSSLGVIKEREEKAIAAQKALDEGNFVTAVQLLNEVADLCLRLGDHKLEGEYRTKAQRTETIMHQAVDSEPRSTPIETDQQKIEEISGESTAPSSQRSTQDKLKQMIDDLHVRLGNITKMMSDLEMDNISGKINDEVYQKKITRLTDLQKKIEDQIKEISK